MRFALTAEQIAFRDAARGVLDKECGPEVVRAAWDHDRPLDLGVWRSLSDLGALAMLAPEADGGLGLDVEYLVPVLEEAGRAALPHPIVETALVAAPLGVDVTDRLIATDLAGPIVANARDADAFVVHDGAGLHLVERADTTIEPVATVDGARRSARLVAWSASTPLDGDVDDAFGRGALGAAAILVGLAERMLAMTVSYVSERQQFGVPVGSFQAVKHQLADVLKDTSFARPAVRRAAHSLATGASTADRDVSMAKALASVAAEQAGRAALQCHGAIGYTVEYDLHLYLKRAWALSRSWGTIEQHRARVGQAIGV